MRSGDRPSRNSPLSIDTIVLPNSVQCTADATTTTDTTAITWAFCLTGLFFRRSQPSNRSQIVVFTPHNYQLSTQAVKLKRRHVKRSRVVKTASRAACDARTHAVGHPVPCAPSFCAAASTRAVQCLGRYCGGKAIDTAVVRVVRCVVDWADE